jgi:bifunctional non-homologous end joining protein LigD
VGLGAYTNGKLRHYGYAGSVFSAKGLNDAVERMRPLFIDKSPFVNAPNIQEKIQWLRPKLVCEVEYAELTADDQLRQTTFLGWREDKNPREVVLELPSQDPRSGRSNTFQTAEVLNELLSDLLCVIDCDAGLISLI